jgi:nucleotide-binding universal stress UspA family protein
MTTSIRIVTSTTILVPFDGTPQAIWTLPIARTIAHVLEGSLHLVMSGERSDIRSRLSLLAEQTAEATLHELMGDLAPGVVRLATFNPDAFIVTPSDLFPEEMLRQAACPVLVVPSGTAWSGWRIERILVPQDGTAGSAKALLPAVRLAERSGSEVLVCHVTPERPTAPSRPGALEFPAYMDQPHHEWPSWVSGFLDRIRHLCRIAPRAGLRFQWAHGEPGPEILQLARRKRVDLIIVSWGRCTDPGHAPIVRQVLRESPCPILVLPCDPF